ncbi:WhiB family transcriptional regulator [Streptomyces sp. NBC_01304]|uniref:WhiB family transcriptional regulator n=1 Tax=Streptomyces sp. NBC_01304 TaxID=2903818 RepID=UPI002E101DAB|nr:WhiB family transcriptional regulator [Streptomyces sp. NBC_01304]
MSGPACEGHDVELFFTSDVETMHAAKQVCQRCPVREACLDEALSMPIQHGVWGGFSAHQRTRMIREGITARSALARFEPQDALT